MRGTYIPAMYVRAGRDTIILRNKRGVIVCRVKVAEKIRAMDSRNHVHLHTIGAGVHRFRKDELVEIL